ncbi:MULTISPECIES: DUF2846 domain-containing protein [unclassified Sphingobium]|uniref:DUF2846 domain-containing protein n=1 Tax=unclassified Sphingobium TaxID=2611147 RepID=UPI002224CF4C|nr:MULTISPECIES: DUF2846 domain-containing protein [unclassified Sphingobium]MCW2396184.1 hypothetical protein [Sphingobium sp. B8D3B]MCW2419700.1 hypothetical protein [Sphingobium sp. B8D3C]
MNFRIFALLCASFASSAVSAQTPSQIEPRDKAQTVVDGSDATDERVSHTTEDLGAGVAAATVTAAAPTSSKIVMFRPQSIMGMGIACPIRYKGVELVELGRGKFAEWTVPAGSYILGNKTASVEVNLTAGQTKYVRCQIKPGFMTGRADLQIVDQESYAQHAADFERKETATVAVN